MLSSINSLPLFAAAGLGGRATVPWGQAFMTSWAAYGASNPRYFALNEDGTRGCQRLQNCDGHAQLVKMDASEPTLHQHVADGLQVPAPPALALLQVPAPPPSLAAQRVPAPRALALLHSRCQHPMMTRRDGLQHGALGVSACEDDDSHHFCTCSKC